MTPAHLITWLLTGRDEQTLSEDWLRDKMPQHAAWTASQQQPGMALIVADVAEMARRQFWQRLAEKREQRAVIRQFGRGRA